MSSGEERPRFRSRRAAVVRPNRALVAIATLSAIAALAIPLLLGKALVPLSFGVGLLGVASLASLRERRWPRLEPGTVEADAEGVRQNGRPIVSRASITQGLAMPVGDGCLVRLNRRWPRNAVDLVVWDEDEGRALLSALGLDAAQTTVDIPAASGHHILSGTVKTGFVVAFGLAWFLVNTVLTNFGFSLWLWILLFIVARAVAAKSSVVRVGVDGVHFRWLWMNEFTRFADVESITSVKDGELRVVQIVLQDGQKRRIPVAAGNQAEDESFAYQRIVQAYELYRKRRGASDLQALARGDRAPEEWLRALRGLAAGANASMRTAPVASDRLWSILDDPSAPAGARAGAAASLASIATPPEKERIRIAAATIAEPKLRVAIEKTVANGVSDDGLAERLAEADGDEFGAGGRVQFRRPGYSDSDQE